MTEQLTGESVSRQKTVLLEKTGRVEIDFNEYLDPASIPDEHAGLRGFNVVAKIDLGPKEDPSKQQSMYVIDARGMPSITTDFLLVDQHFDSNFLGREIEHGSPNAVLGYKGIHQGDSLKVGRSHNSSKEDNRFTYLPYVSRDHLQIKYDGNKFEIENTNPTYDTLVTSNFIGDNQTYKRPFIDPHPTQEVVPDSLPINRKLGRIALDKLSQLPLSKERLNEEKVGLVSEAKGDNRPNQDSCIINLEQEFYAVFDGMGGMGAGDQASKIASTAVSEMISEDQNSKSKDPIIQQELLVRALDEAHKLITDFNKANHTQAGTTGTLAKIIDNNGIRTLVWASVGDSRLYVRTSDGRLEQITRDEGYGNVLHNALGASSGYKARQSGHIELQEGSQIILMTDGICGDYPGDIPEENIKKSLVTDEEFNQALRGIYGHQGVADKLREVSIKHDDKTVIVIGDLNPVKRSRMGRIFSRR